MALNWKLVKFSPKQSTIAERIMKDQHDIGMDIAILKVDIVSQKKVEKVVEQVESYAIFDDDDE